jgi:uncharacterized membrane protein
MTDILNLWNDPHARHAMLIHFPIVLGTLGILPLIVLALTRFRSTPLKLLCVGWFVAASFGAFMAADAGHDAAEQVEHGAKVPLTAAAKAMLEEHEELGENGWIWPLIPGALVALTLLPARKPKEEGVKPKRRIQVAAGFLALAGAVGVGVWVAITADHGGRLVYVYSVGVPTQTGVQPQVSPEGVSAPAGKEHHEDDD